MPENTRVNDSTQDTLLGKDWFFEVLPHRPSPYPGECLSGYLLRLAEANGFANFWDLASDLFPHWHTGKQLLLLRWEYPLDHWGRIPLRAQLSPAQLRTLSVAPWLEKFRPPVILTRPGRLSPGHWLRGAVRPRLQVCPLCLQTQSCVQLLWRLMPVQVCLRHGCWLQGQCSQCGHTLRVVSVTQRHLRCADCGMDLRRLPVESAPDEILTTQARQQADLQFLLNPATSLVKFSSGEDAGSGGVLSKAIGLKLRYLRQQRDLSLVEVAQRLDVTKEMVSAIEGGQENPLRLYLAYVEILSMSWANFAAVEVPDEFTQSLKELPYLSLRVCPTPECPNHQAPSAHVRMRQDMPERQLVRLRCTNCGRRFTRGYDGEWVTPRGKSPIRPIHSPVVNKPHDELARLMELGRQGMSDKRIAPLLDWSLGAVRRHWIVLGVEEEIHQAQVERRLREKRERNTVLRARVEEVLPSLLQQEEEIAICHVSRASNCSQDRLENCPGLVEHIRDVVQAHNRLVRQHHEEALRTQLMSAFDELKRRGVSFTIFAVTGPAGWSPNLLARVHPKTYAVVRQAVSEHNASLKVVRRQRECAQINEAAARLVQRGIRLTQIGILKEAGVHRNRKEADPAIHELLDLWIGDPTQH